MAYTVSYPLRFANASSLPGSFHHNAVIGVPNDATSLRTYSDTRQMDFLLSALCRDPLADTLVAGVSSDGDGVAS